LVEEDGGFLVCSVTKNKKSEEQKERRGLISGGVERGAERPGMEKGGEGALESQKGKITKIILTLPNQKTVGIRKEIGGDRRFHMGGRRENLLATLSRRRRK